MPFSKEAAIFTPVLACREEAAQRQAFGLNSVSFGTAIGDKPARIAAEKKCVRRIPIGDFGFVPPPSAVVPATRCGEIGEKTRKKF